MPEAYPTGNENTAYGSSQSTGRGIASRLDSLFGYDNEFNANEAAKQRNWETQMSNSAYQRATADMKAAGLNPYMMYGKGGSPATTPTGASARASGGSPLPMALSALAAVHSANTSAAAKLGAADKYTETQKLIHSAQSAQEKIERMIYFNNGYERHTRSFPMNSV